MDRRAMLAAFDEQIRRSPSATPDTLIEHDNGVVRSVAVRGGWNGVIWSDLDEASADAAIAAQVSRFAGMREPWEWKHYSYDQPPDLAERLMAAGFTPEPAEGLLVAEIAGLDLDMSPPPGVRLVEVSDPSGVEALVRLGEEVFGSGHPGLARSLLAGLASEPSTAAGVLALAGSTPIAGGRVEFHLGTDFASLWGGGTAAAWRGRGAFRSLVAYRAAMAAARGFRFLQVDASPDSRPILQRLGFVELATTTPFTHPGVIG